MPFLISEVRCAQSDFLLGIATRAFCHELRATLSFFLSYGAQAIDIGSFGTAGTTATRVRYEVKFVPCHLVLCETVCNNGMDDRVAFWAALATTTTAMHRNRSSSG
jgi:hypothetical protein